MEKNGEKSRALKRVGRVLPYLSGGAVCAVFLLVVFAVKGVFPFGDGTMAIMDMCHGYIPVYYHLYDFLHGDRSLFFDFLSGTGVNMVGIAAVNGLLSPLNLLFYLTTRDGIPQFVNLFLLIKIAAVAVSAQVCLKKRFPALPTAYATAFSCLYALSGYVMLYYLHIIWLDVLILFPPLLVSAERLCRGGRAWRYALCLALSLLCGFYLGVMSLIGVFFIAGAYIFVLLPKEERRSACTKLGLGTAVGGLLPMFLLLPAYRQMSASSRYAYTGSLKDILTAKPELNLYTILMFYGLQLAFLFVAVLIFRWKRHPKKSLFALLSLLLLFLPLVLEGTARLWHFGSYRDFPYRFGFIAVFLLLMLAAEQIAEEGDRLAALGSLAATRLLTVVAVVFAAVATVTAVSRFGLSLGSLSEETTALLLSAVLFVLGLLVFYLLSGLERTGIRRVSALVLCVLQLLPFALLSMGTGSPIRYERREHSTDYMEPSLALSRLLTLDNTRLERVHDPDMALNINYGFIMGKGALSNWTHQIPQSLQNAAAALGYSTTYTLLLDGGGTAFSDALLNMRQTIDLSGELPDALYQKTASWNEYTVYQNRLTLPVGLVFTPDGGAGTLESPDSGNSRAVFANQNRLYRMLGGDGELIRTPETDPSVLLSKKTEGDALVFELAAGQNEALYFTSRSTAWNSVQITVNGKTVGVPSYKRADADVYSSEYNNNCLLLGVFSDETVTVRLQKIGDGLAEDDLAFGLLSTERLRALADRHEGDTGAFTAGKNRISLTVTAEGDGKRVFLPVAYDAGWRCEVNGTVCETERAFGDFLSVPLQDGENEIRLRFVPEGLTTGCLLTAVGVCLFAAVVLVETRRKAFALPAPVEKAFACAYALLWLVGVAAVYCVPAVCTVIGLFTG